MTDQTVRLLRLILVFSILHMDACRIGRSFAKSIKMQMMKFGKESLSSDCFFRVLALFQFNVSLYYVSEG